MWKRIQTILLAAATVLVISMLFSRFATIVGPEGDVAVIRYHEKLPYLTLLIMLTRDTSTVESSMFAGSRSTLSLQCKIA